MNSTTQCTVHVQGLHKRFGDNHVLRGIDLQVNKGEVVVIMGPSGSGKTTFIRSLNFLETPDSGVVEICGVRADSAQGGRALRQQIREIRLRTAMVFQSFNLFPHMTALENVIEGLVTVKKIARLEAEAQGMALLAKVGLTAKANEYPARLSGGQKQRVAIARALAMQPEVILFDEPTSALDPELRDDVLGVMRALAKEGMTMLVVTHEVRFAREAADRILFMEGGHVVQDATSEEFFGPKSSERISRFLNAVSE